jgi:aerobic carbon-monoxide dehydrogenase medium subunit
MKPARFAYFRPESVDEAVSCLQAGGSDARVLAGGQSLLALMNRRLERPAALVDLGRLSELRYLRHEAGALRIGALTTHHDLETVADPAIRSGFGILPRTARLIGHLPIRTRGTFGGSLAQADPCSQWCLVAVLLDAQITARGPTGTRTIPAGAFFTGTRRPSGVPGAAEQRTALHWDEILVEARFSRPAPTATLVEFSLQEGNLPLVAAAVAVELGPDGRIAFARVALAGLADRPIRVVGIEQALRGADPDAAQLCRIGQSAIDELSPPADFRADGQYRKELAATLVMRALRASLARAESPENEPDDEKAGAR